MLIFVLFILVLDIEIFNFVMLDKLVVLEFLFFGRVNLEKFSNFNILVFIEEEEFILIINVVSIFMVILEVSFVFFSEEKVILVKI